MARYTLIVLLGFLVLPQHVFASPGRSASETGTFTVEGKDVWAWELALAREERDVVREVADSLGDIDTPEAREAAEWTRFASEQLAELERRAAKFPRTKVVIHGRQLVRWYRNSGTKRVIDTLRQRPELRGGTLHVYEDPGGLLILGRKAPASSGAKPKTRRAAPVPARAPAPARGNPQSMIEGDEDL